MIPSAATVFLSAGILLYVLALLALYIDYRNSRSSVYRSRKFRRTKKRFLKEKYGRAA